MPSLVPNLKSITKRIIYVPYQLFPFTSKSGPHTDTESLTINSKLYKLLEIHCLKSSLCYVLVSVNQHIIWTCHFQPQGWAMSHMKLEWWQVASRTANGWQTIWHYIAQAGTDHYCSNNFISYICFLWTLCSYPQRNKHHDHQHPSTQSIGSAAT
jgi:hypothetical protein